MQLSAFEGKGEQRVCILQVGVEEGVVALAAAPEDVVLAAQAQRGVHGRLDLRRRVGVHGCVGACVE